jgi:hypothetical protein
MRADKYDDVKIVCAGIKVFEKKVVGEKIEYRPVQDGVSVLQHHIKGRQVGVSIQDFCNLLDGGLVSFSTLSNETVEKVKNLPPGALFVSYEFNASDVNQAEASSSSSSALEADEKPDMSDTSATKRTLKLTCVCWRGFSNTLNVMCGKVEMQSMKHQLEALGVLRPKISAVRKEVPAGEKKADAETKPAGDSAGSSEANSSENKNTTVGVSSTVNVKSEGQPQKQVSESQAVLDAFLAEQAAKKAAAAAAEQK